MSRKTDPWKMQKHPSSCKSHLPARQAQRKWHSAHIRIFPPSPLCWLSICLGKWCSSCAAPRPSTDRSHISARCEQAGIVIAACFCALSSTKVALKQINSVRPAYTVYRARFSTLAALSHPPQLIQRPLKPLRKQMLPKWDHRTICADRGLEHTRRLINGWTDARVNLASVRY